MRESIEQVHRDYAAGKITDAEDEAIRSQLLRDLLIRNGETGFLRSPLHTNAAPRVKE